MDFTSRLGPTDKMHTQIGYELDVTIRALRNDRGEPFLYNITMTYGAEPDEAVIKELEEGGYTRV